MELDLLNRHVVITGGTRGIGWAIAKGFLEQGAFVHIIAREIPQELPEMGNTSGVFFYQCDAIDDEALNKTLLEIKRNSAEKIDVVISNVGSGRSQLVPIADKSQWNRTWDTNFISALNTARTFSADLTISKGVLIFISSIAGTEYIGAPTDYSTAKSALIAFAKTLSHKLAPEVRVNVVSPGNIWTDNGTWDLKMKENREAVLEMLEKKVALRRLGQANEVSDLVLFLSSSRAAFITGANVIIDGGQTIAF